MEKPRHTVVDHLAADHPQPVAVIPGSGGLRKVRAPMSGRRKRGGGRVRTFQVMHRAGYLPVAYARGDQAKPSAKQVPVLKRLIEDLF